MTRYDRKLARAVYAMVLLAILAMVLAEGAVVYFAIASLAALISWPIAHGQSRQSAVPRWLISMAVLLAGFFFLFELLGSVPLVSALSHFMIFVQVCKFFETKRARDYAQLIILSMLEIVVAAILSYSLTFAVILIVYLALSVYTLLLFHFKREMELFERAGRPRSRRIGPTPNALANATVALNGIRDRRFWRMSATTGASSLAIGAMLFVFFPRVGEGLLGRATRPDLSPVTGFSRNPRLGEEIGRIKQSDELVMWVTVLEAGRRQMAHGPVMLRGVASWQYTDGRWDSPGAKRSGPISLGDTPRPTPLGRHWSVSDIQREREIRVELGPIDSRCLFAPYPVLAASADPRLRVFAHYNKLDQTLFAGSSLQRGLRYSVWVARDPRRVSLDRLPPRIGSPWLPRLRKLAEAWTAGRTDGLARAAAIQSHLLNDYRYTLNLPGPGDPDNPADPLEVFLFRTKVGHCQYFASAMTVLCQQLGIPARMISGFKAVEYNPQGGYYIVRQKHAHSWVEVYLTDRGWVTFDPTPAAGDDSFETPGGLIGWLMHTIDFMNYKWQQRVLNYSGQDRQALLSRTGLAIRRAWRRLSDSLAALADLRRPYLSAVVAAPVLLGALVVLLGRRRPWRRWLLRRDQKRLRDRGLGFWADLLGLLERRRLAPAPWLTPLETAEELARMYPQVPGLRRLALSYYKVRYGSRRLDPREKVGVRSTLSALSAVLARRPASRS